VTAKYAILAVQADAAQSRCVAGLRQRHPTISPGRRAPALLSRQRAAAHATAESRGGNRAERGFVQAFQQGRAAQARNSRPGLGGCLANWRNLHVQAQIIGAAKSLFLTQIKETTLRAW
jgi:hypothetical protein